MSLILRRLQQVCQQEARPYLRLNRNYTKDKIEPSSKLTKLHKGEPKTSNMHRNKTLKSLEQLRMIAYKGIRFHETQVKMHLDELKRHKKNLIQITGMIKTIERESRKIKQNELKTK